MNQSSLHFVIPCLSVFLSSGIYESLNGGWNKGIKEIFVIVGAIMVKRGIYISLVLGVKVEEILETKVIARC